MKPVLLLALLALALPASASAKAKSQFYVNVGDSYATGYQPNAKDGSPGTGTTDGYADQTVGLAKARGYRLKLRNFGCGGATTISLLEQKGCPKRARAVAHAVTYAGTQADAVVAFLKAHRKHTILLTVSISGNDVTKCAKAADAVTCVVDATAGINTNLKALLNRFRRAAPKVRIVGTTYPDVILGEFAKGTQAGQDLARLSQVAFQKIINPALKTQYEGVGGAFVDVTKATHGYDSLDGATTTVPGQQPYSLLPVPVATICQLTWYCQYGDIHSKRAGYRVIAKLIAATLPKRT